MDRNTKIEIEIPGFGVAITTVRGLETARMTPLHTLREDVREQCLAFPKYDKAPRCVLEAIWADAFFPSARVEEVVR